MPDKIREATPSKAATLLAWELWHQIPAHYQSNPTQWQEAAAKVLDEKLADLLEKARDVAENPAYADKQHRLWLALEPWKPK